MRLPLLPLCPYASYVLGFGFFALVSRHAALSPPLAPRCLLPLPSAVSVTHATTPDTLRRRRLPCPSAVSVCRVRLPLPPRTRHPAPSPSAVSVCRLRLPTPPRTRHRAPCPSAAGSCNRLLRQAHAPGTPPPRPPVRPPGGSLFVTAGPTALTLRATLAFLSPSRGDVTPLVVVRCLLFSIHYTSQDPVKPPFLRQGRAVAATPLISHAA